MSTSAPSGRGSLQRSATTSASPSSHAASSANPPSARLQSQLGMSSFSASSGSGSSSTSGGKPGQLQLPPGFVYDFGPPSGPGSPYDMFGQLLQAQMQQHQEQEYFETLRSQQLRIQHQHYLENQFRERERELALERERLDQERDSQPNLQAHSQSRSHSSSSPSASGSAYASHSSPNESSKPSSTKPLSLPLSLSNSGPGSSSSSGPTSAHEVPSSSMPRASSMTAIRRESFSQHQQQLFQQQMQRPSPMSATTSSGSATTRTSSTSLSERGEVESTAPSSHPSPFLNHEKPFGSGFRGREGSMSSEGGSGSSRFGRWSGHSRGGSRAESISGRSSAVDDVEEESEEEDREQEYSQEQQQKNSFHPGPISLPPPPPLSFPQMPMMMHPGMPMSPHTPQAHAMAAAAAHAHAQAAATAAGDHQQAHHHAAHAHAAHQHAMVMAGMGVSLSPLHHPAVAAAMGQPLGSPYGMYPTSPGHPGMVPLTPHGLPPMTPSMPPFTFLPPHVQMMQQHMAGAAYSGRGASAPASMPTVPEDANELSRRGSASSDKSDSKASGTSGESQTAKQATSTSSARSSGSSSTASARSQSKGASKKRLPAEVQQQPTSEQALKLNLAQVHGAFSPGVAMSPGTFYGRPGDVPGPNPFINAAVGAPVHVSQVPIHPMHSPQHVYAGAPPPHVSHGAYFYAMSSPKSGPTTGLEPQGYFDPMYFPAAATVGYGGGNGGSSLVHEYVQEKDQTEQFASPDDGLSPPEGTTDTSATSSTSELASLSPDRDVGDEDEVDTTNPGLPSRTHSVGDEKSTIMYHAHPARTLSNPQNMGRSESEPVTAPLKRLGSQ
ncbi:hypothetical protein CPB83DRAFT_187197 [Crepidotus variabilis]|uniref:Uncharacterized protein n=1 Tax=Crepidotus variabilis TaxID=179855 RepID=A0A9P6EK95_9AGAR|nr:hypothetical protein CPB83DRAFT_187197 [Crepidotus variabilis]